MLSLTAAEASSGWNSLEITKLVVAVATPLVVLIGGWLLTRWLQKRIDIEDKLVEKRIAVFDEVAPEYNDLLTYLLYWGPWQKVSPVEIIAKKGQLDKKIYIYSWLFAGDIVGAHNELMSVCFRMRPNEGLPLVIRSAAGSRRGAPGWDPAWDQMFTGEDSRARAPQITSAYEQMLRAITSELKPDSHTNPFVSGATVTPERGI